MQIKVKLEQSDAIKLGREEYGNLEVGVDLSTLPQAERDWLAQSQEGVGRLDLNLCYEVPPPGYRRRQLFPPTAEGVQDLLKMAVQMAAEYRLYQDREIAKSKAEEAEQIRQGEQNLEAVIQHLLTLDDNGFIQEIAQPYLTPPGGITTVRRERVIKDLRLVPQLQRYNERLERVRVEDEERKRQKLAEEERCTAAKERQLVDWVMQHGTDSQRKRFAANLLDMDEIVNAIRDEAFAPLNEFPQYEKLTVSDIEHEGYCEADSGYFEAEDSYADEETFAKLERMKSLLPQATITPRKHTGTCKNCEREITRNSLLVKLVVGEIHFSRDYGI